jgi:hypothetical protein
MAVRRSHLGTFPSRRRIADFRSESMKVLIVVAALFASATLLTPTVVQGQYGGHAEAVPNDANNLDA